MLVRRPLYIGICASLFTLSVLALLFLDIDLPTGFHAFKKAALRKFKSLPGLGGPNEEYHVFPVYDDDIEEFASATVSLSTSTTPIPHETAIPSPQHGGDDSVIPDSFDRTYSSSTMRLTSSFQTTVPNGAIIQGFSVLDNLVVHNGTFYIVTNNRSAFPEKKEDIYWIKDADDLVMRGDIKDVQYITADELITLLGDSAIRMEGFSWIMYDIPQFMKHYYHWWGEIIIGGWRTYSLIGLDSDGTFHPEKLELPIRFLLPLVIDGKWRDKARLVGPFMRAAFPQAAIEENDQWLDLMRLNSTIVFDRALVTNRHAAHRHRWGGRWFKMIAGTQELQVAEFNPNLPSPSDEGFWSPLRKSLTRNLLGYLPEFASPTDRTVISPPTDKSEKPVVTYIDRQGTGRRLIDESHKSMVDALLALEEEGICEVQIVRMENVDLREQVRLVARSTIIVGVHGNGLTHQLWMPPSVRSAVIEIVYPGSYDFDYEMLARNLGHKHYIVWNDTLITYKKGTYHEGVKFLDGFHGPNIYVHGPAVAQKIRERVLGIEGDDAEKMDR